MNKYFFGQQAKYLYNNKIYPKIPNNDLDLVPSLITLSFYLLNNRFQYNFEIPDEKYGSLKYHLRLFLQTKYDLYDVVIEQIRLRQYPSYKMIPIYDVNLILSNNEPYFIQKRVNKRSLGQENTMIFID